MIISCVWENHLVDLIVRVGTQKISLKVIGIVILLPNSPLLQKLYSVTAATLVQVKIPESVSSEETNDNVSATLTLAKATSVKEKQRFDFRYCKFCDLERSMSDYLDNITIQWIQKIGNFLSSECYET